MIIHIDGKECVCEKGEMLLEIARRNDIFIPTLCHHEGLPEQGCCRVCIVEVEEKGWRRVVTACVYPVERECNVFVNSDNIKKQREMIFSLLKCRASESESFGDEKYDAPERFIRLKGKCILCGLCSRACESVGSGAISTVNRGIDKMISTPYDEPAVDCVGCGSCARVCPAGAIDLREDERSRTIWNREFELVKCITCGETIGTREELERADGTDICEHCRKKAMTDELARIYGVD